MNREDIKVTLENNILTIEGERTFAGVRDEKFHRVERACGAFRRSFTLPTTVERTGRSQLPGRRADGACAAAGGNQAAANRGQRVSAVRHLGGPRVHGFRPAPLGPRALPLERWGVPVLPFFVMADEQEPVETTEEESEPLELLEPIAQDELKTLVQSRFLFVDVAAQRAKQLGEAPCPGSSGSTDRIATCIGSSVWRWRRSGPG